MIGLSKIRYNNSTPYIHVPKIYKGSELIYNLSGFNDEADEYIGQYFAVESLEDGNTITFYIDSYILPNITSLQYSYNKEDWYDMELPSSNGSSKTNHFNLGRNQYIYFRGECNSYARMRDRTSSTSQNYYSKISASKSFSVSGNINSLMRSDWKTNNNIPRPYYYESGGSVYYQDLHLQRLFYNCTTLVDASNLVIPFDNLDTIYYMTDESGTVDGSTTFSPMSLRNMFSGCTSLNKAPKLVFSKVGSYTCQSMFSGCTSLVETPDLPATTLGSYCYRSMFEGCTSLVNAPELPAEELKSRCYERMFYGCTALVNAADIKGIIKGEYCCRQMYCSCTSLVNVPDLLSGLSTGCYQEMFKGCTSLVKAPKLPEPNIRSQYCYEYMFQDCTSLSEITCLARLFSWFATSAFFKWVENVSPNGIFYKDPNMNNWTTATSDNDYKGIPENWTVQDYTN